MEIAAEMITDGRRQYWGESCGSLRPLAAVGTPPTFRDELTAPEGAACGARHHLTQYKPGAGTRLSGRSSLMPGMVGAALAGMVSAGEILGPEPTRKEVRRCR